MYAVSAGKCFWRFHWTRSAFNFRVGQIKYLHNDKAFHPRKCDSSTQPLRKLQIWCSLSTSKVRLLMVTGSRGMAIREFEIPIILVTHITKFN
jgi:hypothetical protein